MLREPPFPADRDDRRLDETDVATSLESLFDEVWRCEREWRFDDRITLAVRQRLRRPSTDRL